MTNYAKGTGAGGLAGAVLFDDLKRKATMSLERGQTVLAAKI